MRNFKKISIILTVVLALICVLAVAALATEYQIPVRDGWEGPMGVIHDETGWADSTFTDIDDHVNFTNGENDVWVQIGTSDSTAAKTLTTEPAAMAYGNGYRTYYNEYERKVVIVVTGNPHSQLQSYKLQDNPTTLMNNAKTHALYDALYNLFALEYIFTQDAYKEIEVPGLGMTWSAYMSSKSLTDIYSGAFPSVSDTGIDNNTSYALLTMERLIADALYSSYGTDETYAAAFADTAKPSALTGSNYAPTSDRQRKSRALLTGLMLWAQANGVDSDAATELQTAAAAASETGLYKFYLMKGNGSSFNWKTGAENYFGQYGYVAVAFLVNTNTTENANVGCLGHTVDTLEVRRPLKLGWYPSFQTFGAVTTAFDETETILFDTTLSKLDPESYADGDRSFFKDLPSLTTVDHVTFTANGTYSEKVNTGVVDLTGFTTITEQCYTGGLGADSDSIKEAIWYQTLVYNNTDYSGVIQTGAFRDADNIETFTVPANENTPLTEIRANVFRNSKLKSVYVLRSVGTLTVDSTAFKGCSSVTMYVLDKDSAKNAYAGLSAAGVSNVTVEIFNPLQNPVSSTGVLVKMEDFTTASSDKLAIRFQFLWEEKGAAATANEGYTFKNLGIITSTAATYDTFADQVEADMGVAPESVVALDMLKASDDPANKVVHVLVTNADFTDGKRVFLKGFDIETGYYPFCLSLYGMTYEQATTDFYAAAYTEWEDGDGNSFYTFTSLDYEKDGTAKNSISLYDTTLGLFKKGQINSSDYASEEYANKYFYSVLEKGALTTDSFTTHTTSANTAYKDLLNEDGSFTYWNVDYRKYVLDSSLTGGSLSVGWGYKPDTVEAVPSSGVQWSILQDGASYVVVITKNKGTAPSGVTYDYMVPSSGRNSQYSYFQPFHYRYGDVSVAATNAKTNGSMTVYSPAVTQTVYNAITTIIIDDGIVALSADSLADNDKVTTMVFPKSLITVSAYSIAKNAGLTDIIWTGDPDAKSKSKYDLEHLYDLRGCSTVSNGSLLCDNNAAVNVVTQKGINVDGQLAFNNATNLVRYWSADGYSGYTMPAEGTIDVSRGWHGVINKGYFNVGTKITTIIVKATLKSSHNAFTTGEDDRSYRAYGAGRSYNFVLVDDNGEQVDYKDTNFITYLETYITDLHAGAKTAQAANCDNLSVNGVSVKTIFPELYTTAE